MFTILLLLFIPKVYSMLCASGLILMDPLNKSNIFYEKILSRNCPGSCLNYTEVEHYYAKVFTCMDSYVCNSLNKTENIFCCDTDNCNYNANIPISYSDSNNFSSMTCYQGLSLNDNAIGAYASCDGYCMLLYFPVSPQPELVIYMCDDGKMFDELGYNQGCAYLEGDYTVCSCNETKCNSPANYLPPVIVEPLYCFSGYRYEGVLVGKGTICQNSASLG